MTYYDIIKEIERRTECKVELSPEEYRAKQIEWYNTSLGTLIGYDCNICLNKGYVAYMRGEDIAYKPCKCLKIRNILNKAKASGLGDILSDFTFDKYICTEVWQENLKWKAKSFCDDDSGKWFFIGGQSGIGKTFLCTAISAHYIKQGLDVKYMIWCEDSKRLKSIANEPKYQDEINKYKSVDVLYIDDFLKTKAGESPTPADINLAFEIINSRLISDRITIISSEKTLDELMVYDEAMTSRIFQKCGEYKINVAKDRNKNYRLKN